MGRTNLFLAHDGGRVRRPNIPGTGLPTRRGMPCFIGFGDGWECSRIPPPRPGPDPAFPVGASGQRWAPSAPGPGVVGRGAGLWACPSLGWGAALRQGGEGGPGVGGRALGGADGARRVEAPAGAGDGTRARGSAVSVARRGDAYPWTGLDGASVSTPAVEATEPRWTIGKGAGGGRRGSSDSPRSRRLRASRSASSSGVGGGKGGRSGRSR